MMQETAALIDSLASDFDAVVDALAAHERFVVVTHENPDGDALGSMLGLTLTLRELGKDVVMHLTGAAPLPAEYGFLSLAHVVRETPPDTAERVVVAVDCANERRLGPDPAVLEQAALVVDVDHHHDNTRFGSVNLVVADASSTAEIVRDLAGGLGVALTPEIAQALYVGLVTDTGRFQYSNTTPKALRLAADLIEAGADVKQVFEHVYETVQLAKLKLLARALDRAQAYEGGRLIVSYLLRTDFAEVGAEEPYSEGIIDYLRQSEGAELVALIREPPTGDGPPHRVSLRSQPRRDRRLGDRAASRAAAATGRRPGFSSEAGVDEIVGSSAASSLAAAARRLTCRRRASTPGGIVARRQAGGALVVRARRRAAPRDPGEDRPHRHARPFRDRPAGAAVRGRRHGLRPASSGSTSAT